VLGHGRSSRVVLHERRTVRPYRRTVDPNSCEGQASGVSSPPRRVGSASSPERPSPSPTPTAGSSSPRGASTGTVQGTWDGGPSTPTSSPSAWAASPPRPSSPTALAPRWSPAPKPDIAQQPGARRCPTFAQRRPPSAPPRRRSRSPPADA
jgi:hypothetical protein